jgi:hypothetical protein
LLCWHHLVCYRFLTQHLFTSSSSLISIIALSSQNRCHLGIGWRRQSSLTANITVSFSRKKQGEKSPEDLRSLFEKTLQQKIAGICRTTGLLPKSLLVGHRLCGGAVGGGAAAMSVCARGSDW